MNREAMVLAMAQAIQYIEHGGWHTWESCDQGARDRALRQAEACMKIVEDHESHGECSNVDEHKNEKQSIDWYLDRLDNMRLALRDKLVVLLKSQRDYDKCYREVGLYDEQIQRAIEDERINNEATNRMA